MLFEIITTSVAAALVGFSYFKRSDLDDGEKIKKISLNCGLYVKEGGEIRTIQLYRKKRQEWGMEYVYRIPSGLSFIDFEKKIDHIRDGLNNRKGNINFQSLKEIRSKNELIPRVKDALQGRFISDKDVEMYYDGMLHIKVFDQHMPTKIEFDTAMMDSCTDWEVPLGLTRYGFINHDMERGHITLAATKGKTVLLKLLITFIIKEM